MYRRISPGSPRELPLRMLFQPTGNGTFERACEADSFRGLVAAILGDEDYETVDAESRLVHRLRIADDIKLIAEIDGHEFTVADRDAANTINIAGDESFIRSLDRIGVISLDPSLTNA